MTKGQDKTLPTGVKGALVGGTAFMLGGFPCVNLCNAMVDVHTPDERIRIADIETMVDITLAIIAQARGTQ